MTFRFPQVYIEDPSWWGRNRLWIDLRASGGRHVSMHGDGPEKVSDRLTAAPRCCDEEAAASPADAFDYGKLGIRGPTAEFEAYAQQKVAVAQKLGRVDDVEIYLEAFQLGRELLSKDPGGKS